VSSHSVGRLPTASVVRSVVSVMLDHPLFDVDFDDVDAEVLNPLKEPMKCGLVGVGSTQPGQVALDGDLDIVKSLHNRRAGRPSKSDDDG